MSTLSRTAAVQILQNALAHHDAGRVKEALPLYEAAESGLQDLNHYWHFYGLALFQTGDTEKAMNYYRRALLLAPGDANCINRFACIFLSGEAPDTAISQLQHALATTPDHPEAWRNIAEAQRLTGDYCGARVSFEKAMALRPNEASWNLPYVTVLNDLELPEEALQFLSTISIPSPEYYFQEGRALYDSFKASSAISSYRKSLLMAPWTPQAWNNLNLLEQAVGRMKDGVKYARYACVLDPNDASLQHNLTDSLLCAGEIKQGLSRSFWRHFKPEIRIERRGLPKEWNGEAHGKAKGLLICQEQGIGDELRFVSCVPDIQKCFGGPIILETDRRLTTLFARSFPSVTVIEKIEKLATKPTTAQYESVVMEHDIGQYIMLGDLQSVVRPSLEAFPDHAGYLVPDNQEVSFWKERFKKLGNLPSVGISWRSGMRRPGARHLYPQLKDIASLLKIDTFLPVCLQYDASAHELTTIQQASSQPFYIPSGINQKEELDRMAAMTAALDLVVSPSTSVLMMAGAVGTRSIGLHSQRGAAFLGTRRDPWFTKECSLVKTGDRLWSEFVNDEAIPHLTRILSDNDF